MGCSVIPIGLGLEVPTAGEVESQAQWLKDYDLCKYTGQIFTNGIQALIDLNMGASQPVAVIAIGPVPNLAAALGWDPRITRDTALRKHARQHSTRVRKKIDTRRGMERAL
ncbi:MAG: hypothetical protein RMN51_00360 [Verrucomicrobiota bacterium]|nr:hypothetical protein [Limisphaera sp.]MDW8380553.1 hypothetical protein [Verrucomicrobiota bacterium]